MSGAGVAARGDRIARFLAIVTTLSIAALLFAPAGASAECSVHGNIYDWSTFETVNNAIVDVFSMPGGAQVNHFVARTGGYTFSLPKGDYMIVATAGVAGTPSEITATENVTVPDSGERIIDLILFPPGSLGDLEGFDMNATPTLPPDEIESPTAQPSPTALPAQGISALCLGGGAIALALVAIVAGLVLLRMLKPKPPAEAPPVKVPVEPAEAPPASVPVEPPAIPVQPPQLPKQPSVQDLLLPDDCREVLAIMEKNDGRITQLDLRKALPYSEAKVSLIVSDLESRGLVKKIKKGRGNVLIMVRPGEKPPE
jgi:uncharacterized membrane protein